MEIKIEEDAISQISEQIPLLNIPDEDDDWQPEPISYSPSTSYSENCEKLN